MFEMLSDKYTEPNIPNQIFSMKHTNLKTIKSKSSSIPAWAEHGSAKSQLVLTV